MSLSIDTQNRIRPFVSNLDRPVFAIAGLPEEVIAVLLAYYARSREDLRTHLDRLLADDSLGVETQAQIPSSHAQDKARAFHEKWVVGYGHASVAEHAIVHFAVEQVSIIASKAIEDLRLGSFTEKSTRYVVFDSGSFSDLPQLPPVLRQAYRTACRHLFTEYLDMFPHVQERVEATVPGDNDSRRAAAVRAHTCDLLRGLLPAGTHTNLGITANARALATLLCKMLSSPLDEVRNVGEQMRAEASTIAPTLLRHVAPTPYRQTPRETLPFVNREDRVEANPSVRLVRHDHDALQRIVLALCYEQAVQPHAQARIEALDQQDSSTLQAIVDRAMAKRGPHDPAPRAMEASHITVELELDYGAYRDLQRHRMLTPAVQILGCSLGPTVPDELHSMGFHDRYERALGSVVSTWRELAAHDAFAAQYVVPLAYRIRVLWTLNLREVFHVVELRSARQGHSSYRRVAQALYREVCRVHPWLGGWIRVDMMDHALVRS